MDSKNSKSNYDIAFFSYLQYQERTKLTFHFQATVMSDKEKNDLEIDRWAKNAEDHGRMEAQLSALTVQVNFLMGGIEKLEVGQKDLRTEMVGRIGQTDGRIDKTNERIDKTNERIDKTNERIDKTKQEIAQTNIRIDETKKQISELRSEVNQRIDLLIAHAEKESERRQKNMQWLIGTIIAAVGLIMAFMTFIS